MATHSSTLAGKIPWTEEPDRLLMGSPGVAWGRMGSHGVAKPPWGRKHSDTTERLHFRFLLAHSSFLPEMPSETC